VIEFLPCGASPLARLRIAALRHRWPLFEVQPTAAYPPPPPGENSLLRQVIAAVRRRISRRPQQGSAGAIRVIARLVPLARLCRE